MAWNKPDKDELAKEMFGEDAAAVKAKLDKLAAIEGTVTSTQETITKQNKLIEDLTASVKAIKVSSPYDSTPKPDPTNNNAPTFKQRSQYLPLEKEMTAVF